MKYGVLGTGMVGQTLAGKLAEMGNQVMMGAREANNEKALRFVAASGGRGSAGTFHAAAKFGQRVISCMAGEHALEALSSVDGADLSGKIVIDVSNPLDFSQGMPPGLTICNFDSLGESIQRAFPEARVVKALNTCNCQVMVDPSKVPGEHDLFICGNDAAAKAEVLELLREFGWSSIIDMGDITNARATEQLLPIWIRLFTMYGTPLFNFKIVRS